MNLKFKHSGASGDIIYSMPAIKKACDLEGTDAILYININAPNLRCNAKRLCLQDAQTFANGV